MIPPQVAILALVACTSSEPNRPDDTPTPVDTVETGLRLTDSSTGPGVTAETGTIHTGETGETGDACLIPPAPVTWTYLDDVPTSEDFAFDALGNLVNVDDTIDALVRTPYLGVTEILAPYSSPEVAGVAFLLDGRLAMADEGNGSLVILGMDGSKTVLSGALNQPNSITIDAAGQIYVTAFDQILRVDPVTGASTVIATLPGLDLDGLTFSPDYLTLYFNYDEDSVVGKVTLDASGNPLSMAPVVNLPNPNLSELDGMTMDACGNVYAVSTNGSIYRVFTDGTAELLITLGGVAGMTTSSLHFGSGIGGWESDHLYVMNRYGGLFELEIGIDGRKEPHLP